MSPKLRSYLDSEGIKYIRTEYSPAFTMEEVAESAHLPRNQMAKTVIVELGGQMAMAVLPASRKITLQDLRQVTGSDNVKFAPQLEFERKFPDCEIDRIPPFGNLYGMDVYIAETLTQNNEIVFHAGSHSESIKMSYADFERLVHPKILTFAL